MTLTRRWGPQQPGRTSQEDVAVGASPNAPSPGRGLCVRLLAGQCVQGGAVQACSHLKGHQPPLPLVPVCCQDRTLVRHGWSQLTHDVLLHLPGSAEAVHPAGPACPHAADAGSHQRQHLATCQMCITAAVQHLDAADAGQAAALGLRQRRYCHTPGKAEVKPLQRSWLGQAMGLGCLVWRAKADCCQA